MAERRRQEPGTRFPAGGFTLIEMMVALAVFGLAALALLRLETTVIRGAAILDDSTLAGIVAQNVAIEAMTDARAPTVGAVRGSERNGGRGWNWTRTVTATGDPRILRIDVLVQDASGRPLGRLDTVRSVLTGAPDGR